MYLIFEFYEMIFDPSCVGYINIYYKYIYKYIFSEKISLLKICINYSVDSIRNILTYDIRIIQNFF